MKPLVEARDLVYEVDGRRLVDGVDLDAISGSVLAVVGPNGAGKSSLVKLLSGEWAPTSGSVLLAGDDIRNLSAVERARRRAVLPQQTVIQFAFRCLDVVLMGRYARSGPDDEEAARAAMVATDTSQLADRTFPTLSGGEQTRVGLARVLAQQAPVLFLDEPTGSLDLRHQELVMGTLRGLAEEGAAVVAVLHDLNLAARHADVGILLHEGRTQVVGPIADVLTEGAIERTYGHPVRVMEHPVLGCPLILPLESR